MIDSRKTSIDNYKMLANAIIAQAVSDYVSYYKKELQYREGNVNYRKIKNLEDSIRRCRTESARESKQKSLVKLLNKLHSIRVETTELEEFFDSEYFRVLSCGEYSGKDIKKLCRMKAQKLIDKENEELLKKEEEKRKNNSSKGKKENDRKSVRVHL